jgi:hypothetical protein
MTIKKVRNPLFLMFGLISGLSAATPPFSLCLARAISGGYQDLRALVVIEVKFPLFQTTCQATYAQSGISYALEVLEPAEDQKLIRCNEKGCRIKTGQSSLVKEYHHPGISATGISQIAAFLDTLNARPTAATGGRVAFTCPGAPASPYADYDFKIVFSAASKKIDSLLFKAKTQNVYSSIISFHYRFLGNLYVPEKTVFRSLETGSEVTTTFFQIVVDLGIPPETFTFPKD